MNGLIEPNAGRAAALDSFKKRCEKEGLTKDIKKSLYYDKPSECRRRELRKLEKRIAQERLEAAMGISPQP